MTKLATLPPERAFERVDILAAAELLVGIERFECAVVDISPGGARISSAQMFPTDTDVTLRVENYGTFRAKIAWRLGSDHGLSFHGDMIDYAERILAIATYG